MVRESEIRFNYDKALSQVGQLRAAAEHIRNVVMSEFSGYVDQTNTVWKGQSADLFITKCRKLLDELRIAADNYDKLAQLISANAKRTYDSEMTALRIAQERTFNGGGRMR